MLDSKTYHDINKCNLGQTATAQAAHITRLMIKRCASADVRRMSNAWPGPGSPDRDHNAPLCSEAYSSMRNKYNLWECTACISPIVCEGPCSSPRPSQVVTMQTDNMQVHARTPGSYSIGPTKCFPWASTGCLFGLPPRPLQKEPHQAPGLLVLGPQRPAMQARSHIHAVYARSLTCLWHFVV